MGRQRTLPVRKSSHLCAIFGDYSSVQDLQQAKEEGATVANYHKRPGSVALSCHGSS